MNRGTIRRKRDRPRRQGVQTSRIRESRRRYSPTENGHAALHAATHVTRAYQSDSSSKQPLSSAAFSPRIRGRPTRKQISLDRSVHIRAVILPIRKNSDCNHADVAASFQKAAFDILLGKLSRAVDDYSCRNIVIAGGVACNKALRNKALEVFPRNKYNIYIPSPEFCTDNAAMIAHVGGRQIEMGMKDNLGLGASSRL